ncbi:phosphotransferase [Nonomuraea angiospora]|uniref:Aminoglycoside phosphotransferase (APT) family kinase protein n=1 Tax=Nonomuraea angiospora TaxID=46172 RepID=A0ABR9MF28_9ACTN|nr:phosphotransferase [Nonomuraea angiospora]MBE1591148.1 aminoglycoside phosphotransferase (APT) family kinase protein [Nonomuraea angiospora]
MAAAARPALPLPISEPLAKGRPGDGYPFPWSVYRWLPGETTEELADPVEAAKELAGFVSALQRIDATGGPGPSWSNAFRGVPMGDKRDSVAAEARVRPKIEALRGIGHALQDRPTARCLSVWLGRPASQPRWSSIGRRERWLRRHRRRRSAPTEPMRER